MPWVEDAELSRLKAIEFEAEKLIDEPLQAWSDQQAAAYARLIELIAPDEPSDYGGKES
jgi:hypothetical protein